jgi:DNA-directed RNA polymerase specialized sigma24 family protein
VKIADKGVDFVSAPKDIASLFEIYYPYIVYTVRRAGIAENCAEDVASEILLRLYERNFLEEFDPTLTFRYQGEDRPARFKSFLTRSVLKYVRGHYDKQKRYRTRELLLCDLLLNEEDRQDARWVEVFGGSVEFEDDVLNALAADEWAADLRKYLEQVPRRSKVDQCDLPRLWDKVVDQIRRTGEINVHELCAAFNISIGAMYTWLHRMRCHLAAALDLPAPQRRPRRLNK